MAKLTLSNLTNLENETSAVATINENNTAIETALENTLSRDGTSPNTMSATLDMNSNRIYNLPEPLSNTEPLRVIDAVDLAGLTVTPDTAASILAKLITVDGVGSGLDADLLDGASSAAYATVANLAAGITTVNLDAGASGTAGTVDIFPGTAARGKIQLLAANNTGNTTLSITNAAQSATAIHTIPNTNGNASFVMTAADQMIGGAKTFSSALTVNSTITATDNILGNLSITSKSPSAGIGYSAGAGATVVQATSKTTAVTINNICGGITLNNAALAAGAEATFTVNNNTITATDVVIANHSTIGTNGAYMVQCTGINGGVSFSITVTNISAGSLSEAIVINYAIIRAVTS